MVLKMLDSTDLRQHIYFNIQCVKEAKLEKVHMYLKLKMQFSLCINHDSMFIE